MKKYQTLEERLNHVCNEGYVFWKGRWYRGKCTRSEDKDCNICNFASCEL